jgi:hypothetical protein
LDTYIYTILVTPVSSINKIDRHDISEILLKVALKHHQANNRTNIHIFIVYICTYYHIMLYTSPWSKLELTTSVAVGTDCIYSCKSNYHMVTTTAIPFKERSLAAIPFIYLRGTYLLKATNLEIEEGSIVVVLIIYDLYNILIVYVFI